MFYLFIKGWKAGSYVKSQLFLLIKHVNSKLWYLFTIFDPHNTSDFPANHLMYNYKSCDSFKTCISLNAPAILETAILQMTMFCDDNK